MHACSFGRAAPFCLSSSPRVRGRGVALACQSATRRDRHHAHFPYRRYNDLDCRAAAHRKWGTAEAIEAAKRKAKAAAAKGRATLHSGKDGRRCEHAGQLPRAGLGQQVARNAPLSCHCARSRKATSPSPPESGRVLGCLWGGIPLCCRLWPLAGMPVLQAHCLKLAPHALMKEGNGCGVEAGWVGTFKQGSAALQGDKGVCGGGQLPVGIPPSCGLVFAVACVFVDCQALPALPLPQ